MRINEERRGERERERERGCYEDRTREKERKGEIGSLVVKSTG